MSIQFSKNSKNNTYINLFILKRHEKKRKYVYHKFMIRVINDFTKNDKP